MNESNADSRCFVEKQSASTIHQISFALPKQQRQQTMCVCVFFGSKFCAVENRNIEKEDH